MKKLLLVLMVLSLAAMAVPALATECPNGGDNGDPGCNVSFDVNVHKTVYKAEFRTIMKFGFLYFDACLYPDEWAEVEVVKCDVNARNYVVEVIDPSVCDFNFNLIENSYRGFDGIAQVNQGAGSINNQGNVAAVAVTVAGPQWCWETEGLAHSQASATQTNTENGILSIGIRHWDVIENSFQAFSGIAQVNQASGYMNNQNNVAAVAANLNPPGVVALSDGFLTQQNVDNGAVYALVDYNARISGSFNAGAGIAQVNQSPGSMNNQANVVSIAASGVSQ